jgi:lipoprotein-releasing system permease protein
MGFPLDLAFRYMRSRKRASVSLGTMFAILGVALGVAALATVMSVTGGFREQFRDKVLGVNAHVLVLKYSNDFREYRKVIAKIKNTPGVTGIAPFVINPMMVTHGQHTVTGVLLKGVDPEHVAEVLDLPRHIVKGSLNTLRVPGARPPPRTRGTYIDDIDVDDLPKGVDPRASSKEPFSRKLGEIIQREQRDSDQRPLPLRTLAGGDRDAGSDAGTGQSGEVGTRAHRAGTDTPDGGPATSADGSGRTGTDADEIDAGALPDGAPSGNVEPDGGYGSTLPDDDVVPEEVDPDPCKDGKAVAKLPGIAVGVTLKKKLALSIGDCVQVTSPMIGFTYSRGPIRAPIAKQFRVIAVFDAGFDQYDSKLVYTDLYEAQAFYDSGDSVTGIEMKVKDIDRARDIARGIDAKLNNGIYHTMDWEELNHGLFTALRIQQILMSLVLALIIVVAAFTVIATLIMVVLDKRREIAVLKAMGANNGALLRAFLYQGTIIGVIGTAIGLAIGLGVCKGLLVYGFPLDPGVYFISELPVQVRPVEFGLVGVFAVLVCLGATVWPAFYAARLRPAEAFRGQQ